MITLADAKVGESDKVRDSVIDEFRKTSILLDRLVFDDAVNPTGGSTLAYGYLREKVPAVASFREVGEEYTPQETTREKITTNLKIFGGSFEVDRVIENTSGRNSETSRQLKKKVKVAASLFHYTAINGDSDTDSKTFDGLDKILKGTSTELNTDSYIDVSDSTALDANFGQLLDALDEFLASLDGVATFLMMNTAMATRLTGAARRARYLTQSETSFGVRVNGYNHIPILDMGWFAQQTDATTFQEVPVVPVASRAVGTAGATVDNLTDIYAAVVDLDHFFGITVTGSNFINSYLPDYSKPGAIKKGEAEMIAAVALGSTRGAAVLRNIKIK